MFRHSFTSTDRYNAVHFQEVRARQALLILLGNRLSKSHVLPCIVFSLASGISFLITGSNSDHRNRLVIL